MVSSSPNPVKLNGASPSFSPSPKVDAQELILCTDANYVCETYIFEPSAGEEKLGHLFAAAEVEDRGGVGRELVDMVVAAIQSEYFRDRDRSPIHSFELALHQANLILHDAAERGVRDWMGYFQVAIGALVGKELHVSVAGDASVWLARKAMISCISDGLSHLPITNPLRTFSQVASGEVAPRDVMLFATGNFPSLFHPEDVVRFTIDHSADTVTSRLRQLYEDQRHSAPLSLVTVSLLPDYIVQPKEEVMGMPLKARSQAPLSANQLKPRKALTIHRPGWHQFFFLAGQAVSLFGRWVYQTIWPRLWHGGKLVGGHVGKGGAKLFSAASRRGQAIVSSASTSVRGAISTPTQMPQSLRQRSTQGLQTIQTLPKRFLGFFSRMPKTSKVFAIVAVVLFGTLLISLQLLSQKRSDDQEIQRAAELLHDAQTKNEAASTALIYNNREQAQTLLGQAVEATDQVAATGFYANEIAELRASIQSQQDRLQKIVRANDQNMRTIGDFATQLASATPTSLFFITDKLYTFNPSTNSILAMSSTGEVQTVSEQTKEIGFFTGGISQSADKTILFSTSDPGLALFDAKDNSLRRQDIALNENAQSVGPMSLFGNRLYMFDAAINNITVFNKTLRGFSGGTPWITDSNFPAASIRGLTVDGNIYTLNTDGSIHRLFKGAPADFTLDSIEPPLTGAQKIFTNEDAQNLYILDQSEKRIAIFTKKGGLVKQIFFAKDSVLQDMAIDDKEATLYALEGAKVIAISLAETEQQTAQ